MLKNLPPGWMTVDNETVFQTRNLFYVSQNDGKSTSIVSVDNAAQDIHLTADMGPTEILKKANDACGEILDIVKIYSNRTGKENEGVTYYLNRKSISEMIDRSYKQNEETVHYTSIIPKTANAGADIYLPMQKVIDILSTTTY